MPQINLLNTDNSSVQSDYGVVARLVARLLMVLLSIAVIIFLCLFAYNWLTTRKITEVKADIQSAQSEAMANKDRNELVTRQEQLAELETLIDNHVYWSYLLPELARVTLRSAKYTEIGAKSDGSLDLIVNLPNYDDIEKYMQIFDLPEYNQQFSNVRIVSINSVQAGDVIQTQLRLELTFNPEYIKGRM